MSRKLVSLLTALALALTGLLSLGCAAADSVTVTDMTGREVTLPERADRIVALTASDCEILYALGAGDLLVGRGEYCDYPEAVLSVPSVQSGAETNIEQIVALAPQVVLMATMAQTTEQVEALEHAGIRVLVSDAQNIQGVYEAISMIGKLVGHEAQADALIGRMRTAFSDVAAQAQPSGKTVYFEVSPLQWGLWVAGKGTFMDEIAALCGLTNAFSDVDGWASISEEQVLERDPDYIVTTTMYFGEGPTPVEEIRSRAGWEHLKAIENDGVFNADADEITRPGPRLMDAIRSLFDFIQNHEADLEPAA